uniref:lamin tail domain-containing protein n=1 Tax=Ornithinicoccus halotolerans TaxID=1748220 RepID=UPI001885EC16
MTTTGTRRALAGLLGLTLTATGALAAPAAGAGETGDPPAAGRQAASATGSVVFSEYVEGSSHNKALEVANLTGEELDLAGHQVQMYFNGSSSAGLTIELAGTLAPGEVHVVAHASAAPELLDRADQTNGAGWFNGDDAVVLTGPAGILDAVGQVEVDPGSGWGSAPTSTLNTTLRRASSVCAGDTEPTDAFDPAAAGWAGHGQDAFDGLGEHRADCGGDPADPTVVINEFSASTAGEDVEYLELFGPAGTDLSGLTVLQVEGDASSSRLGQVVSSHPAGTTGADGRWLAELDAGTLQNGSLSLLLVEGYQDQAVLDADHDGRLDEGLGLTVVDAVAVADGGSGDLTYGGTTLTGGYDGVSDYAPGGASRVPDGTDTGTAEDWVRNDFDLAGIEGHEGTLGAGEARNTPGAPNEAHEAGEPDLGRCEDPATPIGEVQGDGVETPVEGEAVTVQGTVVGDFQTGGFDGYYLQDGGDEDPATSDGIFVHHPGGPAVAEGDTVRVTGTADEYFQMT